MGQVHDEGWQLRDQVLRDCTTWSPAHDLSCDSFDSSMAFGRQKEDRDCFGVETTETGKGIQLVS